MFAASFAVPLSVTLAWTRAAPVKLASCAKVKHDQIVLQINSEDAISMRLVATNSLNAAKFYHDAGEPSEIEIVAYGAGVHMFRTDTSPVMDLLKYLDQNVPNIAFSVCGNTKAIMEQTEGHALSLIEGVRVVPAGVIRIVQLQEAGWSYMRH